MLKIKEKIKKLEAEEISDSRGTPTIRVHCELLGDAVGDAAVPSGKSTGVHEALELRDGDMGRCSGQGVLRAVQNVNQEINEFLANKDFDQESLDQALIVLDGTENKQRLGANAILGVSLAFARASAKEQELELYQYIGNLSANKAFKLPTPLLNIINGGQHSDSGLDIQEFMIAPVGFDFFYQKIEAAKKVIASLEKILQAKNYSLKLGDEGGFAPHLASTEEVLDIILEAIEDAGYTKGEVKIALDAAASSFFHNDLYHLSTPLGVEKKNSSQMIAWYEGLVKKYPIISIEDGLAEDDWAGFTEMTKVLGDKIKIVGDDLTVTNPKRIQNAIEKRAINAVLIKLNQIGTLSETITAIKMTEGQGWVPFVSHRSGETMDTFIADLAVGLSSPYIKAGALSQKERACKYERLLEIERSGIGIVIGPNL